MSTCPSCGDDANVDKVSGIYRAQSAGFAGSNLSRLLAPPHVDAVLPRWEDMERGCLDDDKVLNPTSFRRVMTGEV